MFFTFSFLLMFIIFLLLHLLVSLDGFKYVYINQNLIILYGHQHQLIRYLVLNLYEYISFYGLSLKLIIFQLYKIEPIHV
jgi:hypothetical protein